MSDLKRTVVIEMTDDLYNELVQAVSSGGFTFAELLIGHACAAELNRRAADGDLASWMRLVRAWRTNDPDLAIDVDMDALFGGAWERDADSRP